MDVVIVRADKTWARLKNPEGFDGDFVQGATLVRQEVRHIYATPDDCRKFRCADCVKIYREWNPESREIKQLILERVHALIHVDDDSGTELCPLCGDAVWYATATHSQYGGFRLLISHHGTTKICRESFALTREEVFKALGTSFNPDEGRFPFIRGADETVASP